MPAYTDHLYQSAYNFRFLELINHMNPQFYDWEVTICYYIAVHLINAHLSLHTLQLRKHFEIKEILRTNSNAAIPHSSYIAYNRLQNLSRRSRYLVNDKNTGSQSSRAFFIFHYHLREALDCLHTLMSFFKMRYGVQFEKIKISYPNIDTGTLCYCRRTD